MGGLCTGALRRIAACGLIVGIAFGAAACASTFTREQLDGWRARDMQGIERLPASERVAALNERILRDMADARWWGAELVTNAMQDGDELSTPDVANIRLMAPAVEYLAADYLALGRAHMEAGDSVAALVAFERAIWIADNIVLSGLVGAELRAKALNEEATLWRKAGEPRRSAAAQLLAKGAEKWIESDDGRAAGRRYQQLIAESVDAANQLTAARNASVLAGIGQVMNAAAQGAQQIAQQQNNANNTAAAQGLQTAAQTMQVMGSMLSSGNLQVAGADFGALTSFFDQLPALSQALRDADIDALSSGHAANEARKLMEVLTRLRSGRELPGWVQEGTKTPANAAADVRNAVARFEHGDIASGEFANLLRDAGVADADVTQLRVLFKQRNTGAITEAEYRRQVNAIVNRYGAGR